MAYEIKENVGNLFKNKYKDKEGQPDYRCDGVRITAPGDYKIAAWINTDKNGAKYMKLKFELPEQQETQRDPQSISQRAMPRGPAPYQVRDNDPISSGPQRNDMDDDIPF